MTVLKEGRPTHRCEIPSPASLSLGAVVECECGRRWKLRRVGWSFKEWRRTVPTFVRDVVTRRRAVNMWAPVSRWDEPETHG